jgi:hypothetical protein
MITLNEITDYWMMLAIAAVFGAVGGFVYELLQTRDGQETGAVESVGRKVSGRFFDLGWLASAVIGAGAAVAILYFFPPTITIQEGEATTTQYDLVSLVALSLIVGSAGRGIWDAVQQRVTAALNEQKALTFKTEAQNQVEQVGIAAKTEAENAIREALTKIVQPQLDHALQDSPVQQPEARSDKVQDVVDETIKSALVSLDERMDKQVEAAKKVIA